MEQMIALSSSSLVPFTDRAAADASTVLADQLLHADNIRGQRAFVHETSTRSKALQAVWRAASELEGKVR